MRRVSATGHDRQMSNRIRFSALGRARADRLVASVIADASAARQGAGLSLDDVARAAAMSRAQAGRLLRGDIRYPTTDQLSRLCAAVGLDLAMRAYPGGDPVRDVAHTALLARFRLELHPSLRWRTEVPMPIEGDRRAWDATIQRERDRVGVEAETRLADVQAMQRRIALKQRDAGLDRVVLVIADTRANRRAFESAEAALRSQFPLGPREVLRQLRAGRLPEANGYVFA